MRLIDADALAERFVAMQECASLRDHVYLMGVLSTIDNTPTIDAAPVVRCKDCAYRGSHDLCPMCVRVYQLDESGYLDCTVDDGFCHCGWKMDAKEEQ